MKKMIRTVRYLPVIALVLSCAALAFSAGEKERMAKRVPKIDALKTAGVIGEQLVEPPPDR